MSTPLSSSSFELRVTPTATQVFMFSAVTWNRHRIHFSLADAKAEGFPDVVVQRGLLGNYLARLVTGWAGAGARLERLQWKVMRSTFPGGELVCRGSVTRIDENDAGRIADCALEIVNAEGEQIAAGSARVRITCS